MFLVLSQPLCYFRCDVVDVVDLPDLLAISFLIIGYAIGAIFTAVLIKLLIFIVCLLLQLISIHCCLIYPKTKIT